MADIRPVTVALSVRPLRAAILVPAVDELAWQSVFRLAFRACTATWGGAGNLVLPMPDSDRELELFWTLLELFDPEVVRGLHVSPGLLADVDPEYYARWRKRWKTEQGERFANLPDQQLDHMADSAADQEPLSPPGLEGTFGDDLELRIAPLSGIGHGSAWYGFGDLPPWPLVGVEKLKPLPDGIEYPTGWSNDDAAVLAASTYGEPSRRLVEALNKRGLAVVARTVEVNEWQTAAVIAEPGPMSTLAALGLQMHFYPGRSARSLVFCVGDSPWDFALATALDRFGIWARWVPTRAIEDLDSLSAYWGIVDNAHRFGADPVVRICSFSSMTAASQFDQRFNQVSRFTSQVVDPLSVIPRSPARLYERENVGSGQMTLVHGGKTPRLATPIPQIVETDEPTELYWMTDVEVVDWSGIRHPSLQDVLVSAPGLMPGTARTGRDALSYLCPAAMPTTARSLAYQAVQPWLAPLSFAEQVTTIFERAGWTAAISDKGIYLQRSAELFGGVDELVAALSDPRAELLNAYLDGRKDAPAWRVEEKRICLSLEELRTLLGTDTADELVPALADSGVLVRGLVLQCNHCLAKRFYVLADLGQSFTCQRCRTNQQVTGQAWRSAPEPTWRYRLAEVVNMFLEHDGDLPVLAGYDTLKSGQLPGRSVARQQVRYLGEIDVWDPEGVKSELDVTATDGTYVWVGEASSSPRLEKTNYAETKRLTRLANIASILGARGVLLINAGSWDQKTLERAAVQIPGWWPKLHAIEHARRAGPQDPGAHPSGE